MRRNSKNCQKVHSLIFFTKKKLVFPKKNLIFLKMLIVAISLGKAIKLVKLLKIFKNSFFFKKKRLFYPKKVWMFYKLLNVANLPLKVTEFVRLLIKVQTLGFFETEIGFWKNCFQIRKMCRIQQFWRRMRQK